MTAPYISTSRREEVPRAIMIAVEAPEQWCGHSAVLAQGAAAPTEHAITTPLARWRRDRTERAPEDWALEPGMPLYLVHGGQVRGWAPIVGWTGKGRGPGSKAASPDYALTVVIAPREWHPVGMWWTFREHYKRGWRYVRWLPETERPYRDWAEHNRHAGCGQP